MPFGPRGSRGFVVCAITLVAFAACSADAPATSTAPPSPSADALDSGTLGDAATSVDANDDDEAWSAVVERCGNGLDDDGDGVVDEDCAPSLFLGWFPPGGSADLDAGVASHVAKVEKDVARPLSVIQTYRSTTPLGAARAKEEIERIWAHGAVAHLYLEPPADSAEDFAVTAQAVVSALATHASGRLLLSFGAEMNGVWTAWGCKTTTAPAFIAMSRKMHAAVSAELAKTNVDRRRLRWVYPPNSTSSGGCGTPADYYPGHDVVDLLGMSAYRSGSETVASAVTSHATKLMTDLAYPTSWQRGRFIVLQTGSRTTESGDRGAWLTELVETLAADARYAGVIPFDLSHSTDATRDWALLDNASPPAPRSGYDAFTSAVRKLRRSDAALEGIFDPFFWDVARDEPAYAEIQALRASGLTSGCQAAPPLFCPTDALTRAAAKTLLARAFAVTEARVDEVLDVDDASASVRRSALARATGALLLAARPQATKSRARLESEAAVDPDRAATRAEAARWIVHAARIAPAPRP